MSEESPDSTVDLADLAHHDRAIRAAAAESIGHAFARRGYVSVINHGVDFALRDRLYARFHAFTERSEAEKSAYRTPEHWFQRGWTSGQDPAPWETFLAAPMPAEASGRIEHAQLSAPNVWPEGDEAFSQEFSWLGQQLHEAGLSILTGVAISTGLVLRTFDRRVDGSPHLTRLQRNAGHPPTNSTGEASLLTVSAGPLDIEAAASMPEGDSESASESERPIVARVGQQLEILTGGRCRMAPLPTAFDGPHVTASHELYLALHEPLTPLERFRTDDVIRAYAPPVLAGTYRTKTLIDTGLAPANALDRVGFRPHRSESTDS